MNYRKNFILFISILTIFLSFFITKEVFAENADIESIDYTLLAPLPLGDNYTVVNSTNPVEYIPNLVRLVVGLAGALAVIMIIVGGFQYISSDGFGKTSNAKEKIQNALLGLLLIIGSYAILYTLNPKLVNLSLSLERQEVGGEFGTNLGSSTPNGVPSNVPPFEGYKGGDPWPSDSEDRTALKNLGISVNKFNCTKVGQGSCTSVYQIGNTVIYGLDSLRKNCRVYSINCEVLITGGTEYWLHSENTAHRPGGNVVDLRLDSNLLGFLKKNGTPSSASGCATGTKYIYPPGSGITYVNEAGGDPHFHVCFK